MLRTILLLSVSIAWAPAHAADHPNPAWSDDFDAAARRAASEDRAVLLNFTGSDWCVWCFRLRDEVFSQEHFLDFANEHLVLVEVDFPRRTVLDPDVRQRNSQLQERFEVGGFPTIVLLNAGGAEIGRLGYMEGGAKTFVRELRRLIAADQAPPPNRDDG